MNHIVTRGFSTSFTRGFTTLFATVLTLVLASAAAAEDEPRSILVMDLKASGTDVDTARTINSSLAVTVSRRPKLKVMTGEDVRKMLDLEAQKVMLGCEVDSCLAEVASAMGAELVLYGDIGKLGSLMVINLHLFNSLEAKSVGRETIQVRSQETLIAQLNAKVVTLLAPVTGEVVEKQKPITGVAAPTVDLSGIESGGLKNINIDAETKLEAALDVQENPDATAAQKATAWCAVADVPSTGSAENPYVSLATKACQEWNAYAANMVQLETSLVQDYQTLASFFRLRRKTREQKLSAITRFLETYRDFEDRDRVRAVRKIRSVVDREGTAQLHLDEDGDGIFDDACPEKPEDFDGEEDGDGCPEESFGEMLTGGNKKDETPGNGAPKEDAGFLGDFTPRYHFTFADDTIDIGPTGFLKVRLWNTPLVPDPSQLGLHSLGGGVRFTAGTFEMAAMFEYVLDPVANAVAPLLWQGYFGLRALTWPDPAKLGFGLIDPSFGVVGSVPADINFDAASFGGYVANTFDLFEVMQVRVMYMYTVVGPHPTQSAWVEVSFSGLALVDLL